MWPCVFWKLWLDTVGLNFNMHHQDIFAVGSGQSSVWSWKKRLNITASKKKPGEIIHGVKVASKRLACKDILIKATLHSYSVHVEVYSKTSAINC